MNLAMCEVPVHPVEYLPEADLAALPELPMTLGEDGLWYCDGVSTQGSTSGKNLFPSRTEEFVKHKTVILGRTCEPGVYKFSAIVTSNDTDTDRCIIYLFNGSEGLKSYYIERSTNGNRSVATVHAEAEFDRIYLYASSSFNNGEGDTARYEDIQLEKGEVATPYEPYTGGKPSPNPDYPQPIVNTYPAGTYKAICGDKTYKVVLDDDLRSVGEVADLVIIDAGRGLVRVERKTNKITMTGNEFWSNTWYPSIVGHFINIQKGVYGTPVTSNYCVGTTDKTFGYSNTSGMTFCFNKSDTYWNFADHEECKAWVKEKYDSGNPMYFCYVLAAPTTTRSITTQLTTIPAGQAIQLTDTVNDKMDYLEVRGDSWQLVKEQGRNLLNLDKVSMYNCTYI